MKINNFFKKIFHFLILLLIIFSLYPGSIMGYLLYGDIEHQPNALGEFLSISLNHFFSYLFISLFGLISYFKDRKFKLIVFYLFFLSIILELAHFVIVARKFETSDLKGNILGVLLSFMLISTLKYYKKNDIF